SDPRAIAIGSEGDDQARSAGWHRLVACLAPRNLDQTGALEPDVVASDQHPVYVDGEDAAGGRFQTGDIAHPAHQQPRPDEVVEDLFRGRRDLDRGPEGLAHRFFSRSSFSVRRREVQKLRTNSSTGANPSGRTAYTLRVPSFRASTSPACPSTARCCETAC